MNLSSNPSLVSPVSTRLLRLLPNFRGIFPSALYPKLSAVVETLPSPMTCRTFFRSLRCLVFFLIFLQLSFASSFLLDADSSSPLLLGAFFSAPIHTEEFSASFLIVAGHNISFGDLLSCKNSASCDPSLFPGFYSHPLPFSVCMKNTAGFPPDLIFFMPECGRYLVPPIPLI